MKKVITVLEELNINVLQVQFWLFIKNYLGTYGDKEGLKSPSCSGLCFPGYYCLSGSTSPTSYPCPPGRFQSQPGQGHNMCEGDCLPGYYCSKASISNKQIPCSYIFNTTGNQLIPIDEFPNQWICPGGSSIPSRVLQGYYSSGGNSSTRSIQYMCEKGFYCENGIKIPCPAGTFGSEEGLSSSFCSGLCSKGHYCLAGSTNRKQFPCLEGYYGNVEGLKNSFCSGPCRRLKDCKIG